jgi:type III secretion protein J
MNGFTRWFCILSGVMVLSSCRRVLEEDLDQQSASEMVWVLFRAGIPAEKSGKKGQKNGWSVQVEEESVSRAMKVLREEGIPRPSHAGFMSVYRERGLIQGRLEEQALYLSALQEEIAQTLEGIDGVFSARVHVSMQTGSELNLDQAFPASAAVVIAYRSKPGQGIPITAQEVRQIVANATAGLLPERVAVVFSAAGSTSEGGGEEKTNASRGSLAGRTVIVGLSCAALFVPALLFAIRQKMKSSASQGRKAA